MPRKQKKYHYIYKTTNVINDKFYIGMHSTSKLDDGYMGSGKQLKFSMNYHGEENFKKEILEFCETRDILKKREREIVNEQLISEDLCMNLIVGGEGGRGFTSEEQKLNNLKSQEVQKKLKEVNPEWFENLLKNRSKGHKKSYDEGRRERYYFHDWNGKKHSEDTKLKMSESSKGMGKGENNSQFGKCWITNEIENKKIMKGDLIPDGWRLGRKMK